MRASSLSRIATLAAAILVCWSGWAPRGRLARAERRGLLLWNRLGSRAEIARSEVGPGGQIVDREVRFVPGRFGGALSVERPRLAPVRFPLSLLSLPEGTIEFWARLRRAPELVRWGAGPFFVSQRNGPNPWVIYVGFNGNDGGAAGGLVGVISQWHAGTSFYTRKWRLRELLGDVEAWHHYAMAWSQEGLQGFARGPRHVAVYLDGEMQSSFWIAGKPNNQLVPMGETFVDLVPHQPPGSRTDIDNLKIWSVARTDFGDRFEE